MILNCTQTNSLQNAPFYPVAMMMWMTSMPIFLPSSLGSKECTTVLTLFPTPTQIKEHSCTLLNISIPSTVQDFHWLTLLSRLDVLSWSFAILILGMGSAMVAEE
jgi:hypothetical protein